MNRNRYPLRLLAGVLALALAGGALSAALAGTVPTPAAPKAGVTVYKNAKAEVDASNLAEGFVTLRYTGGKDVKIKAQITKSGATDVYTYNLDKKGAAETFPLTEGDGTYNIKVFENTTGNNYAQAYACKVDLALRSEFLPFLYPNQYVNFTQQSKTAAKAAELTKGKTKELDKVAEIYHYTVEHISYDYELAKTVKSGYLPDVDAVLKSGKGICFDYAAVMAAMLRSQGIPCKLVVGYAGKVYHAWINVYISGTGWVDNLIYFDGESWSLMDPTFVSNGKGDKNILKYVGDGSNYTQTYAY